MTNELITQQASELTILKQQNEILNLKLELQKSQAQKISKLENSLFSPELFVHYKEVSEYLAKSTLIPKNYMGKPGDIFIAMEMGYQLGLPMAQALQDIAVINGRPSIYGDGFLALILSHSECEYIKEERLLNDKGIFLGYRCIVKRKGHEECIREFTLQTAQKAGLLGKPGPWQQYTEQMCFWRALGFAGRAKFADALRGIKSAEEILDYVDVEYENVKIAEGATQTEKLKTILEQQTGTKNAIHLEEPKEITLPSGVKVGDGWTISQNPNQNIPMPPIKNGPATSEQLDLIMGWLIDFTPERKEKAFAYYKIEKLEDLTEEMADKFIEQLEKS